MSSQRLPFEEIPWFVLDGRLVEFPEGIKTDDYTHTLHRFPGKFVPQVARELLKLLEVNSGSRPILDPFCGSATQLIEAATYGVKSVGLDIDYLAVFIAKVKTTPLTEEQLRELKSFWKELIPADTVPAPLPEVKNLTHWFTPERSHQIAQLKGRILTIADPLQRDFSLAVLSSIIRRVSNADDQTQKTYVSGTLKKKPPLPTELFPIFMSRAIAGMTDYARACREVPAVDRMDARNFALENEVSAVATSPPYIDSIDYVYNQMLEYFWLHDVLGIEKTDDIKDLRKQPMGFRKVRLEGGIGRLKEESPEALRILQPVVDHIQKVSLSEALNVVSYFVDFTQHLSAVNNVLAPGMKYALVIGESFIRGVTVPTPEILVALFNSSGYNLLGRCSYLIKRHYMKFPRRQNSRTITVDHVLCFERI